MMNNIFIFIISLYLVIKGSLLAIEYSEKLAKGLKLSKYIIGFMIIAIISILPETMISINSAIKGVPDLGLGLIFGSNVADLTLIFALMVLLSGRSIKVESKILKKKPIYPFLLLLPLILGLDGYFSRIDGLVLLVAGIIFYYLVLIVHSGKDNIEREHISPIKIRIKNTLLLLFSMILLLIGSHFLVISAIEMSNGFNISPIIISMFIISLGTTMPELFFAYHSVKKGEDSLAIGDILGSVLADATIVVGIIALISPFYFPIKAVYISIIFMSVASYLLFSFMKTEKKISKKEAHLLIIFWLLFITLEYLSSYF